MPDNPSFVLRAVDDVVYEQRPIPEISGDQVLVEVKKTGICGSDVHYLAHGRIGDFIVDKPMLCTDIIFAATPPYDGTLGRYYRLPEDLAYPLPDSVTLEDGAMIEPLAVGIHSVSNLGSFRANQAIAVFGCGPVGLLCMAVAKALGASRVVAVDINPARLEFAKSYAATDAYLPPPLEKGEARIAYSRRNAEKLKRDLGIEDRGSKAIDLVIDASGADVSIQTALYVAKSGGTVVQVGMGNPNVTIDIGQLTAKELNYKGSFRYGAIVAFKATREGKSEDGKGVIKAIISGPDFPADLA
ncbi:hypothetical protein DXG03_000306 [Asterophora parasitica]|uniref:Enoyl reductase (ER) domain-containing protein n=1 Tax=Asterophora parasitica TaxID=117018 RepID=A0A9P7GL35_9AGAR|nr:hypothetical protein DXG03_000306 [Asterophora parasitica]